MTPHLTAAQLRRDLADAHRLQTVSVAQTVAERAIQAVEARDELLREALPRIADMLDRDGYSIGDVKWMDRIEAITGDGS
jgi:hypothetical protein